MEKELESIKNLESEKIIESLESLRSKFAPAKNVYTQHRSKMSPLDKIALAVTNKVGTMGFFLIIVGWTATWLSWNLFAPKELRFDPFPAFFFWVFISNILQLHLLPLILVGQNLQGKYTELRSEHDYETNVKAEKEVELIITYLEKQQKILERIEKKLG